MSFFFFLFFFGRSAAQGILVSRPGPGIELVPPAVEARCLNHWTAREVPKAHVFNLPYLNGNPLLCS